MHPTTTQVLVAIGVAGLAIDSAFRYLRIRRSERGPLFVVSWLVVASALAAGMVASERRRTAVRSTK